MWKKNDAPIQTPPAPAPAPAPAQPQPAAAAAPPQPVEKPRPAPVSPAVTIGASVVIKGEVSAREDLTVAGRIEGKIEVRDHVVRVGREAQVNAEIAARAVIVDGNVKGNITATERIELSEHGVVEGDIASPKIAMADGAQFRGKIEMGKRPEAVKRTA